MSKKDKQKDLDKLRHSTAHLLAKAVLELWPKAQNAIGPAIENGFYQDFDMGKVKISEDDLPKIEKKMHDLLKTWKLFKTKKVTPKEAKKAFSWNKYKLELIEEFTREGKQITLNNPGNFLDLCRGGHVEDPKKDMQHFKLLSIAGAYWRGSEKNKMLTRIYGTAFPTKQDLKEHLKRLEEAKKRDHRKIGKDLDLFTFSNLVGKGLPLFTEKGATIWREIERFVVDEEIKRDYKHVRTPNIAKTDLYRKSGHYPYYKETMYPPMIIDDDELILRPMTCPHHFALFMSKPRSYKELPIRYAEMASLYRYEKSGELTGLIRVREFVLADSHNFVAKSQAANEVSLILDLIEDIAKVFNLKKGDDFTYRLSLGDRNNKEKYYHSPENWEFGEKLLEKVLIDRKAPFYTAQDEAAFYGPKIDVQMKNALGKEETAFTVQYDICLPDRFDLRFTNEKGDYEKPIVIHRSSVGAMERTIGFLIEHFAGAFPVWLAPLQAVIIPISQDQNSYAETILKKLKAKNVRAENWNQAESMQNRIRKAESQKIPFMLIVGKKEEKDKTISVRQRGEKDLGPIPLEKFIGKIRSQIDSKVIF